MRVLIKMFYHFTFTPFLPVLSLPSLSPLIQLEGTGNTVRSSSRKLGHQMHFDAFRWKTTDSQYKTQTIININVRYQNNVVHRPASYYKSHKT